MERKIYLSIVIATLVLGGCANIPNEAPICVPHYQDDLSHYPSRLPSIYGEPALILRPFEFTGRAWFDTDRAILRPEGKSELDKLSVQLLEAQSQGLVSERNKVVIIGHTDSRGSRAYNQHLSERRAKSVARYLKTQCIPTTAMLALGKGELQPVASNRTHAGMQKNRRVEIHIDGQAIRVVSD